MSYGSALGVAVATCLVLVAACGEQQGSGDPGEDATAGGASASPTPGPSRTSRTVPAVDDQYTVEPPGPLQPPLHAADVLVVSQEPLDDRAVARIRGLDAVQRVEPLSVSQVSIENRVVNVAAVDPASYRKFTPDASARLQEAWDRVAGGEVAVDPALQKKKVAGGDEYVRLGNDEDAPRLHVGAWVPLSPQIDAVVNQPWGEELGIREGNAMLLSTGINAPQQLRQPLRRIVGGEGVSVQMLDAVARFGLDPDATQNAVLIGGSVAEAVGSFSYQVLGGSERIRPEQSWVDANIRTEQVPLLGKITCHTKMLPQLRAALREVASRGLGPEVHQTAGCYYPRFIAGTTKLSLHSFGIAIDINSRQNQRGTQGQMHPTVVEIFKKWGFAWGGDWGYTDPMHFEMNRLVDAR